MSRPLQHPLLEACGVSHGFGTRDAKEPQGVVRATQVHGRRVAHVQEAFDTPGEADALLATAPGLTVGIVTADCVPILIASRSGDRVAAVHAGWKGLAAGVIEAALDALRASGETLRDAHAAVGPHVGACCYEVDAPVLDALRHRFADELDAACTSTRAGHARVDLGRLARVELERALPTDAVGGLDVCTHCDAERFHSYRRDGPRAGRMLHWIATRGVDTPFGSP